MSGKLKFQKKLKSHIPNVIQLKHTGLPEDDLLYFYLMVIRTVLEYGGALWHHGQTVVQSPNM